MEESTLYKKMLDRLKPLLKKVLKVAKTKRNVSVAGLSSAMEDAICDFPDLKSDIEDSSAVLMLPYLLEEKGCGKQPSYLCSEDDSIDDKIEQTKAPRLICAGEVPNVSPLYLCVEGTIVARLQTSGLPSALCILLSSYYVFNMTYPPRQKTFFLEHVLLSNSKEARKRVAVQKFLSELE